MNRSVVVVVFGLLSAAMVPSLATAASDGLLADISAQTGGNALGTESISSGGQKASYSTSASVGDVLDSGGHAGTTFVRICVWPDEPADDNCG